MGKEKEAKQPEKLQGSKLEEALRAYAAQVTIHRPEARSGAGRLQRVLAAIAAGKEVIITREGIPGSGGIKANGGILPVGGKVSSATPGLSVEALSKWAKAGYVASDADWGDVAETTAARKYNENELDPARTALDAARQALFRAVHAAATAEEALRTARTRVRDAEAFVEEKEAELATLLEIAPPAPG